MTSQKFNDKRFNVTDMPHVIMIMMVVVVTGIHSVLPSMQIFVPVTFATQ
jgi:hypothetical protein